MITIFKNIKTIDQPFFKGIGIILDRIRNGSSKGLIKDIRQEADKTKRNLLKQRLPAICFSGTFSRRADEAIKEHSGFICLDFDDYEDKKLMLQDKERMSKDPYTYAVFISPSDLGLKVIVKIPRVVSDHVSYFNALEQYYKNPHFDTTSKNVSRVCYESYDPQIYINENSEMWDTKDESSYEGYEKSKVNTIAITNENKIVDILLKWQQKRYPMIEGQRNNNMWVIAQAFNEYGINKSLATHVLRQYAEEGFPVSEIDTTIESAYKHYNKHNTKVYEDTQAVEEIKSRVKSGQSKKDIRHQLEQSAIDPEGIDTFLERIEDETDCHRFWRITEKGSVKINSLEFKRFLEDNGFYKYSPEDQKTFVFIRIQSNLVDHATEGEIKDFVLNYLISLDDPRPYNYFAERTSVFAENYLNMLSTIDVHLIRDDVNTGYLYFRNCAVRVQADRIDTIDYIDLGGYVWREQIIEREFRYSDIECDFRDFVHNICNNDRKRIESMESTIGFLLHGYKSPGYCPAVILNDENISVNPEGGTGKGLLMQGIGKMKKTATIDGKHFDFSRSFPYQTVQSDTQVIVFDDVKKNFAFENLFSVITEGLTLEKKNKDAVKIDFHHSPKIAITTNYAIRGTGNSFARRKWELELYAYYTMGFTPENEFNRMMFSDWPYEEYCSFYNYMLTCLKGFLDTGLRKSPFVNLKKRRLQADTSYEFIEWCGLVDGDSIKESPVKLDARSHFMHYYHDFVSMYPDYSRTGKESISQTTFYKWIISYCQYLTGKEPEMGRDAIGKWLELSSEDVRSYNESEAEKEKSQLDIDFE